jgi:hypothetical protein
MASPIGANRIVGQHPSNIPAHGNPALVSEASQEITALANPAPVPIQHQCSSTHLTIPWRRGPMRLVLLFPCGSTLHVAAHAPRESSAPVHADTNCEIQWGASEKSYQGKSRGCGGGAAGSRLGLPPLPPLVPPGASTGTNASLATSSTSTASSRAAACTSTAACLS